VYLRLVEDTFMNISKSIAKQSDLRQQAGGTESAFVRNLDALMLQLVCAVSQVCHAVSCEVVCCRCLLLLIDLRLTPNRPKTGSGKLSVCSPQIRATQPQLSATQKQLSRAAHHAFQALELH